MARRNEEEGKSNVIQIEREEFKKPSLQIQLDVMSNAILNVLDEEDKQIKYAAGTWYVYKSGYWAAFSDDDTHWLKQELQGSICSKVGLVYAKQEKIIWTYLEASRAFALSKNVWDRKPLVAVQNGTVNIETGELLKHDPKHYTTRYVDITYVPDAKAPNWLEMLGNVFSDRPPAVRDAIVDMVQEWFGVALAGGDPRRTPRALRKALFLYGPPRSGKSTICDVLKYLLGTDKIVTSPPGQIVRQHGMESFVGASGWICEEVDGLGKAIDPNRIKAIITGETLTVPRKFKRDTLLEFKGPVLWAGNSQPNFPEASGAIYDRMFVVATNRTFTADEAQKKFGKFKPMEWLIQQGEMSGIFVWALNGYRRLLERGKFQTPQELELAGQEWRSTNDVVYAFISECCDLEDGVYNDTDVLTWTALAYAKSNDIKITAGKMRRDLRSVVPERLPDVVINERVYRNDGSRVYVYKNLLLNENGLAYLRQAERDSEIVSEKNLKPNLRMLGK